MAKLGSLDVKGASGVTYTFEIYPFDQAFNQVGAVYLVTHAVAKPEGGHIHSFLYVGQTWNLPERFGSHHKLTCFQKNGANRICVLVDTSERSRLAKEADLLKDRTLPCND